MEDEALYKEYLDCDCCGKRAQTFSSKLHMELCKTCLGKVVNYYHGLKRATEVEVDLPEPVKQKAQSLYARLHKGARQ